MIPLIFSTAGWGSVPPLHDRAPPAQGSTATGNKGDRNNHCGFEEEKCCMAWAESHSLLQLCTLEGTLLTDQNNVHYSNQESCDQLRGTSISQKKLYKIFFVLPV